MTTLFAAALSLLASCGNDPIATPEATPEATPPPTAEAGPEPAALGKATGASLVLVTMDTTKRDRMGAYGYDKAKTPVFDKLAAEGARFDRAYAVVPLTTPSHASMLTGLYPTRHGVRTNGNAILPESIETLAERLQDAGYETGASISAFVTTRVWNLDQGFDQYMDSVQAKDPRSRWKQERPADEVVDDAIDWLSGTLEPEEGLQAPAAVEGPFFLWVHLYDPHAPYSPPEPYKTEFANAPYDGEIAFMDAQIGRLQEAVDAKAGEAGANWIVLADHGEALKKEHGEATHGLFLFEQTARIPFVVRPAKPLAEPIVVDTAVSGADVTPTALALLGQPPLEDLDGEDLSGVFDGKTLDREPAYMESYTARQRFGYAAELGVVHGSLKLIDTPNTQLFDVDADADEETNLASTRTEDVDRLRVSVQAILEKSVQFEGQAPAAETVDQLAALGYVGGGFELDGDDAAASIDAKDRIETIRKLESVRAQAMQHKDLPGVERTYREILAAEPQLAEARLGLARVLQNMRRGPEAIAVYQEALAKEPESAVLLTNYATCLATQRRFDEGIEALDTVLAMVPNDAIAQSGKLKMLSDMGADKASLDLAREWLLTDPENGTLQAHIGVMLSKFGDNEQAQPYLEFSLLDGVHRQFVHRSIAEHAFRNQQYVKATRHFRREIDMFGHDLETRRKLGDTLMKQKRWDEAEAEYNFVLDLRPEDARTRRTKSQAIFNTGDYPRAQEELAMALKITPEDPDVLLLHANIEGKMGNQAEAEAIFEKAKAAKELQMEAQQAARSQ